MITVRCMKKEDCEKVSELEKEIFSQPWSLQGFEEAIEAKQHIFLVAEKDGTIVGYLGMYLALDEGEITNVAVAVQERKKGIADLLIREAIRKAKEREIIQIVLEVRVSNDAAIRLYEKNGFKHCGIRKGFYDFPKEDAYIMMYNQ